jgi:hypothetical protein
MGWWPLRVAVWLVSAMAVCGNIGVIVVLCYVRHARMRVHYFFMVNLATADLCIGIACVHMYTNIKPFHITAVYLSMLAIEDAVTLGEYANHAVDWQTGNGCKIAGFLAVFGSQLSIACMTLISAEIWYNTKLVFNFIYST